MNHTPEPWTVTDRSRSNWWIHATKGNGWVAQVASSNHATANAARIVACVNFCAGVPTAYLTREEKLLKGMAALDGCANLNPAAYWECVEALQNCYTWLNELEGESQRNLAEAAQQALAHAMQEAGT